MKKALGIILALTLMFGMAIPAAASAADDFKQVIYDLCVFLGLNILWSTFVEVWQSVSAWLN